MKTILLSVVAVFLLISGVLIIAAAVLSNNMMDCVLVAATGVACLACCYKISKFIEV